MSGHSDGPCRNLEAARLEGRLKALKAKAAKPEITDQRTRSPNR